MEKRRRRPVPDEEKYLEVIPVGAPEIIRDDDGQEYITSNYNLAGGTMICKLGWE